MYKNQILTLEDTMKFGKHIGETIEQMANDNSTYIGWMIENIDNIAFSEYVVSELDLSDNQTAINEEKLGQFRRSFRSYKIRYDNDNNYDDSSDWEEDNCYAMTDGMYGDMPDGFDGDYIFLGY